MAAINKATGFVSGLRGSLADIQQRKQTEKQAELQKSELEYARQRRAITDQRADTEWQQKQDDRATEQAGLEEANKRKQAELLKQAEQEGVKNMIDALEAGADPAMVEQRFNASGAWKVAPGTLKYDKNTNQLSFSGAGGNQFNGTSAQLRALFGAQKTPGKLATANKNERVYDETGRVVLDAAPEDAKFEQVDPEKDLYEVVNGKRTLVRRGTPKPSGGSSGTDGEAGGGSGQKLSTYNPQSHQEQAIKVANDAYRKKRDELGNYVFENPEDSERQADAAERVGRWMSTKGSEAQNYGAGEVGSLAFRASKQIVTAKEAGEKAAKAGLKVGTEQYSKEVARLIRDSDVKAAQVWNEGINKLEAARDKKAKSGDGDLDKYWK